MLNRLFLAAVMAMTMSAFDTAHAGDATEQTGFYILGRLGSALPIDQDIDSAAFGKGEYDPDGGFGLQGAIGYRLGNGWRAEVSFTRLEGEDGKLRFDNGTVFELQGDTNSATVLFNLMKTIGSLETFLGTIHPFVGAGVGFSRLDRTDVALLVPGPFTPPADGTDTVFAAALHLGYDTQLAPGVTLTSQWTFQYADEGEFRGAVPFFDSSRDSQVQISTFTGLRFDLN